MKRKRGPKAVYKTKNKRGRPLAADPAPAVTSEDELDLDRADDERVDSDSDGDSSPEASEKWTGTTSAVADLPNDTPLGKLGFGRVKVKLKSSRPLETHHANSDAQAQSDTNLGRSKAVLPVRGSAAENREDSGYSDGLASDLQTAASGKSPRKSGSIKIISSRGTGATPPGLHGSSLRKQGSSMHGQSERGVVLSDNERTVDTSTSILFRQMETRLPYLENSYNEKELKDSLEVIKKIMKMDAAEPFNAPVDPVALGIPDYFDVIDHPMDFGTICDDIEHGRKYFNSEDIFKDVQLIWENCVKYNNKGDYIVDLMRRVKKNFMKYWMAAGLCSDVPSSGATEIVHTEDIPQFHQEKTYFKAKSKHKRKRHGTNLHKSDCMCAVCIMKRRRKEREENSAVSPSQMSAIDRSLPMETKLEDPVDILESEHTSSSLGQSPEGEPDAGGDVEEPEVAEEETSEHLDNRQIHKLGFMESDTNFENRLSMDPPSKSLPGENTMHHDSSLPSQDQEDGSGFALESNDGINSAQYNTMLEDHNGSGQKQEVSSEVLNEIKLFEDPSHRENHSILHICRTLFSIDQRSVWCGPHSLNRQDRVLSTKRNPIHSTMAKFLK